MNYIVTWQSEPNKRVVKNNIFTSLLAAETYAEGIDDSRNPEILPHLPMNPQSNGEFTCNDIDKMSKLVEDIRMLLIFSFESAGTDNMAEHLICQATDYLSLSVQALKMAELHQTKATTGRNL